MDEPYGGRDGRMTLYDPIGNPVKIKFPKPLIKFEVETARNKQSFTFQGPYNSRHCSRALAIVERMSRRSVSSANFRFLG